MFGVEHFLGVGGGGNAVSFPKFSFAWSGVGDFQSYLGPDLYPPKRPAMYGYQFLFPQAMKTTWLSLGVRWSKGKPLVARRRVGHGGSFVGTVLSLNSRNLTLSRLDSYACSDTELKESTCK